MDNRRQCAKMPEENRGYKESSDRFLSESPGISIDYPWVAWPGAQHDHSSCSCPIGYFNEGIGRSDGPVCPRNWFCWAMCSEDHVQCPTMVARRDDEILQHCSEWFPERRWRHEIRTINQQDRWPGHSNRVVFCQILGPAMLSTNIWIRYVSKPI